ncbi:hypothetical protein AGR4C_pb20040 [Agrobacterium tumefaciens str. Kerr 14]|uniref:Uncharacterized protein n=1 Tax=Agrobacterium tumefaciens str. Kerr 14 TaxID=1183424 RepID=A0A1S7SDV5_AGRTU|nr:hypothetical protein AGR4C_pb20040 [Agrobacterium tumefaciens str. Kerr 14]
MLCVSGRPIILVETLVDQLLIRIDLHQFKRTGAFKALTEVSFLQRVNRRRRGNRTLDGRNVCKECCVRIVQAKLNSVLIKDVNAFQLSQVSVCEVFDPSQLAAVQSIELGFYCIGVEFITVLKLDAALKMKGVCLSIWRNLPGCC